MKYSFLIPYHDRIPQFVATLVSFKRWYGDRNDCELVVVVDGKSSHELSELESLLMSGTNPFPYILRLSMAGQVYNPAPHYNQAASLARGDYFILTSPEILHTMDILSGLDAEFDAGPEAYVVCACENMGRSGKQDDRMPWYQHSRHRNCSYHFCTSLSQESWARVGGFDERFSAGVAYDDDDFLRSVKKAGLEIKARDDLVALHQWHDKPYRGMPRRRELVGRNKALYEAKWEGV